MKIDGSNLKTPAGTGAKKPGSLSEWLVQNKGTLETVIPKGTVNLDRFMQSALLEIMNPKQPMLAKCTPLSILRSLKESASLGLEVGGVLGQAYLIPYNESVKDAGGNWFKEMTCHFQMGYKGLIALARRSNTIKTIACEVVYENDIFSVEYGVGRTINHSRDFTKPRGKEIAYYCLVELVNGGIQFDVESVEDIKEHRAKFSKSYNEKDSNNVWNKNFNAMALKTCAIQALKLCPISIEALEAVRKDELNDIEPEMRNVTTADYTVIDDVTTPATQAKNGHGPSDAELNAEMDAMGMTDIEVDAAFAANYGQNGNPEMLF